ncbi:MAG: glycosyltransferase family 4 protein [Pleurocapsa sp. MO_192.B19]|nr:glycosyltransferase family 4 protein [Pleurocapsa sp. MO_192.B19]
MKIAVIGAKGLPARQGGIEHYCKELYSRMVEEDHSIDVFARASYIEQPWLSVSNYQGIRVFCVPSLPLKGLDAFICAAIATIVSTIKGYDIIHFHALGPAIFCFIPKLFSSAQVVVTCHGLDWKRAKWNKFARYIIRLGEKNAVRYAHKLIVVSQYLHNYFHTTYGLETNYIPTAPSTYSRLIPNFSYSKSLGLKKGRYILFLGRLVPEKRPDLLIEAFQLLNPRGWKLVIVGSTKPLDKFKLQLIKNKRGNENIIFTNELRGSYLSEIVSRAGLFVLPSDLEGLPLAMLEAMKEGIPIIASNIAPHQQLIGSKRGMLFQAGNIQSLSRCLKQAISQPEGLQKMAEEGQKYVKANYRWDKVTYENLQVYTKLAAYVNSNKKILQITSK